MKRAAVILLLLWLFAVPVSAQADENYTEGFSVSGAGDLTQALPDETRNYFDENDLNPADPEWVNRLTGEGVFKHLFSLLTGGLKTPVRAAFTVLSVLLIAAAFPAFSAKPTAGEPATYAALLGVATVICVPLWQTLSATANALRAVGTFMLAFIPVFAITVTACGGSITAISMSGLLLAAAEGVSAVSAFGILPLMGGYLAMNIGTAVSPLIARSGIADAVKRIALWTLSLISTVFVGILGIQTAVNASADTLALKTAKFVVGSSIPIAGAALSEAVSTLTASLSLLRSSVGIYGVVALAAMLLPIIAELLLWRVLLQLCSAVSELLSVGGIAALLHAIDTLLSLMLGILLLIGAVFIISLTVVITFGRTAA